MNTGGGAVDARDYHGLCYLAESIKIDGLDEQVASSDFYALGVETLYGVAASHGRGVRAMIDSVLAVFPDEEARPERKHRGGHSRSQTT